MKILSTKERIKILVTKVELKTEQDKIKKTANARFNLFFWQNLFWG